MPGGEWTPLAWDAAANRYALDVWQDIAVHRQTLWTATPAGAASDATQPVVRAPDD